MNKKVQLYMRGSYEILLLCISQFTLQDAGLVADSNGFKKLMALSRECGIAIEVGLIGAFGGDCAAPSLKHGGVVHRSCADMDNAQELTFGKILKMWLTFPILD
jgi:hypothetical protein